MPKIFDVEKNRDSVRASIAAAEKAKASAAATVVTKQAAVDKAQKARDDAQAKVDGFTGQIERLEAFLTATDTLSAPVEDALAEPVAPESGDEMATV